jgi:hypothetical protein
MNIAKYEEREREIRDEVISLIKSRRTPEGNIIADNTCMEIWRDLFLMELNIPKIPKKRVAGESITYYACKEEK